MKKIPTFIYKTSFGEGVTYSATKGNHWGEISTYTLSAFNNDSKKVKVSSIKERVFVNQFGYIN